jgi:type I restriction enzyme M protein
MVETARQKAGRVAVVVPQGVLFRGGSEGKIRQKMIEENLLDAVVGLPGNLFQTTAITVAVLVFDRRREAGGALAKRKDVLFIDASREFQPAKTQNILLDEHIAKIIESFKTRKDVEKYAHDVPVSDIIENGFNLNIARYIDTFEAEEEIDIGAVQAEIVSLETELAQIKTKMAIYLKELGVDA